MYCIIVKKIGYKPRKLLVQSLKRLQEIIDLSSQAEYLIESVERFDYELGKDFLEEIKSEIKPKGLEFGNKQKEEL